MFNVHEFFDQYCNFDVIAYSGRGMFGEKCLAVTEDSNHNFFSKIFEGLAELENEELKEAVEGLASLMNGMRIDDMGRGYVFYFPSVPPAESNEIDE